MTADRMPAELLRPIKAYDASTKTIFKEGWFASLLLRNAPAYDKDVLTPLPSSTESSKTRMMSTVITGAKSSCLLVRHWRMFKYRPGHRRDQTQRLRTNGATSDPLVYQLYSSKGGYKTPDGDLSMDLFLPTPPRAWRWRTRGQRKMWVPTVKAELEPLSGPQAIDYARCRKDWANAPRELAQDRRARSASIRNVVSSIDDTDLTRSG